MAAVLASILLLLAMGSSGQGKEGGSGYTQEDMVVFVDDATNGSCLPLHMGTVCSSLEAIASGIRPMKNMTSLEIVIRTPRLELKEAVKFEGLSVVRITGVQTQIQCAARPAGSNASSSAGMVLVAIENLLIRNVTFEHCGTVYEHPTYWDTDYMYWKSLMAAIHILNSTNILVRDLAVSYSNGAGLAVSNVQEGTLNISDSWFNYNTVPVADRGSHSGGAGVFVQVRSNNSKIMFDTCTFVNNTSITSDAYIYPNIFGRVLEGRGHGGGLLVRILGEATNNTVNVTHCNFTRNLAFLGGGLAIEINQRSQSNLATISSSHFEENGCHGSETSQSWSGGGLNLGYNYREDNGEHVQFNAMVVHDSVIARNCAEKGGGVTFFSSRSDYPNTRNSIRFNNCSWIENSGRYGTAVDISPNTTERLSAGYLPTPEFIACEFINNSASIVSKERGLQQAAGTGALFSSQLNIKFFFSVLFQNNTDSALVVVNAEADFSSSSATFVNNTGVQGGAISLMGASSMVIGPGHVYDFLHNRATGRGGAISSHLFDVHDFAASRSCFIQYSETVQPTEWNSTLNFIGNDAPIGRSIFTTAITPCLLNAILLSPETELNRSVQLDPKNVFHWPSVFFFDGPTENQIATEGAVLGITGEVPFEIIPGEVHILPVNITDDLGQLVDTALRASIDEEKKVDVEIDTAFSYVEDKRIQLEGEVGKSGDLMLRFISPRDITTFIEFILVPCPAGYLLNEEKECECDVNSYEGLTKCNTSSLTAYIRRGFWVGYFRDSLVTAVCPVEFCKYGGSGEGTDIPLPQTSSNAELDAFLCGPSRTGVLCGNCREGFSASYHSPYFSCRKNNLCSIGWLFYILSELVPVTILFITVLVLNVKFTSGKLNGFILFSQMIDTLFIDSTDLFNMPDAVHTLSWGYRIIYGFFSLDLFTIEPLSFCLWEGATVLDVLAFKYVTIAYALVLVILVIVFMKYSARRMLGNHIKISTIQNSVIHGLSAFLVVCYMQCIKVSLRLLSSTFLQGRGGTLLSAKVWFSGEVEVFSPEHLLYAIPALLCLLTLGSIPPVLLLVYPFNNKITAFCNTNTETCPKLACLTKKVALNKLKPILDSFQGCFKDNFRFFAGLYFVYRWAGLLVYALSPRLSGFYATLQVILTLMLLIHAVAQPYEKRWFNIVDALLLTNLAVINLLTGFSYYYTRVSAEEAGMQQVIDSVSSFQLILIYLPILVMCLYLIAKSYKNHCKKKGTMPHNTMDERPRSSTFWHLLTKGRSSRGTTDIGSPHEFPARMLEDYHQMDTEI